MEGLARIKYNFDINAFYRRSSSKVDEFLERFGRGAVQRMLEKTISEIKSEDGDAIITTCFWEEEYLNDIFPFRTPSDAWTILAFPEFGTISEYALSQDSSSSRIILNDKDPIVVADYKNPVYVSPECDAKYISLAPRGSSNLALNLVTAVALFKHNFLQEPQYYPFLQKLAKRYPRQFKLGA